MVLSPHIGTVKEITKATHSVYTDELISAQIPPQPKPTRLCDCANLIFLFVATTVSLSIFKKRRWGSACQRANLKRRSPVMTSWIISFQKVQRSTQERSHSTKTAHTPAATPASLTHNGPLIWDGLLWPYDWPCADGPSKKWRTLVINTGTFTSTPGLTDVIYVLNDYTPETRGVSARSRLLQLANRVPPRG